MKLLPARKNCVILPSISHSVCQKRAGGIPPMAADAFVVCLCSGFRKFMALESRYVREAPASQTVALGSLAGFRAAHFRYFGMLLRESPLFWLRN